MDTLLTGQRFCKPKVGSSILSTGTIKPLELQCFSSFPAVGKVGGDGEQKRFCQPRNQDHLFTGRSHQAVLPSITTCCSSGVRYSRYISVVLTLVWPSRFCST